MTRRARLLLNTGLCLMIPGITALTAGPLSAQDATPAASHAPTQSETDRSRSFAPDFFTTFQCVNALDMVNHVPGFVFNGGDTSLRGFAGAAGNVLIDGERPASKNEWLGDILYRIPASQVERVDLIIGGAPGIDMQGQPKLVNIIRRKDTKPGLSLELSNQFWDHGLARPYLGLSFNLSKDKTSTELGYERFYQRNDSVNDGSRTRHYTDGREQNTQVFARQTGDGATYKLGRKQPLIGGKLSLNAYYLTFADDYKSRWMVDGPTPSVSIEDQDYLERSYEGGARYERPLTKTLKLETNLLMRRNDYAVDDRYNDNGDLSVYLEKSHSAEGVFAANVRWQPRDNRSLQFGIEQAHNMRRTASSYFEAGQSIDVPSDQVEVSENRTEYSLLGNAGFGSRLSVETGFKVEASTIAVKGTDRSTSLVYTKPRLQLIYTPAKGWKVTWRSENTLNQLDFGDFAASVDFQTTTVSAGNIHLVPTRKWIHSATIDYSFWEKGNISLTLERSELEDVIDYMALVIDGETYTTRGNIGPGHIGRLDANLLLPFDKLGIKGLEVRARYTARETEVTDPITGLPRPISNQFARQLSYSFAHTIAGTGVKWGATYSVNSTRRQYRVYEIRSWKYEPWVTVFVEYKLPQTLSRDTTISARIGNAGDQNQYYDRTVYQGLRGLSGVAYKESNISKPRPLLQFKLVRQM